MSARAYTFRNLTSLAGAYTVAQTKTSDSFLTETASRVRVYFTATTATNCDVTLTLQGSTDNSTWFDISTDSPVKFSGVSSGSSGSHLFECPSKYTRVKLLVESAVATLGTVGAELSTVA